MGAEAIRRVAVLGAGTIGASWAALFLAKGLKVDAWDPAPRARERLEAFVEDSWPVLRTLGLRHDADRSRLHFHADAFAAVDGVDFVQESGPERADEKVALYRLLDQCLPPEVVVASSSSGLRIGELQRELPHPGRYLIGHPFNPPHLLPLVEVVAGPRTEGRAVETAMDFYRAIGKRPILLRKEVRGHVANRLQAALWREAIHLAADGVASVADIDAAVAYGPGLRWALMGPSLTFHLGGGPDGLHRFLDHLGPAFGEWWDDLGQPRLDAAMRMRLAEGVNASVDAPWATLARERDQLLLDLLRVVESKRELP